MVYGVPDARISSASGRMFFINNKEAATGEVLSERRDLSLAGSVFPLGQLLAEDAASPQKLLNEPLAVQAVLHSVGLALRLALVGEYQTQQLSVGLHRQQSSQCECLLWLPLPNIADQLR